MWLHLRQVALVARDLDAVIDDLRGVFDLAAGPHDPNIASLGLRNEVLTVGTQFLEVVAPIRDGTTAERYLDRRGGDGGYLLMVQTDDHAARRARVDELGIRIVARFDDEGFTDIQLHPADTGGTFLAIEHQEGDEPEGAWSPAGPHWPDTSRTEVVDGITGAEIQCVDPDRVAARWSSILDVPVEQRDSVLTLALADAELRFVLPTDGRGEGLSGLDLHVVDGGRLRAAARARGRLVDDGERPEHVLLGGVRMYV